MGSKKLPAWALVAVTILAIILLCGLVSLVIDLDLEPWAQRAMTCIGLSALVVVLAAPHIGVALLRENPKSTWGLWLVEKGIATRKAMMVAAEYLPALAPAARRILASFPEAEVPSGVAATVSVEQGASLTVKAEPGSVVTTSPQEAAIRKVPLLCLMLVALAGCGSLDGAKATTNTARSALIAAQPVLHEWCTVKLQADLAMTRALPPKSEERQKAAAAAMDADVARHCPAALNAYDAARSAHIATVATIAAIEAGSCVGVSQSAKGCNLAGALLDLGTAAAEVSETVRDIKKEP